MKIIVHLTPAELRLAATTAVDKEIRALVNNIQPVPNQRARKNVPWWHHSIVGYTAEVAACKALGYEWLGADPARFKDPDCGPYQVRSVEDKASGLKIRTRDSDDDRYILAQVAGMRVCLHGWMSGRTARQVGDPAFEDAVRVDICHLFGMEELNEWDEIDWSDEVEPYDPDDRIRQYRASMIG